MRIRRRSARRGLLTGRSPPTIYAMIPDQPAPAAQDLFAAASPGFTGVETWIFDLDNTLYPASSNVFSQVERRMTEFIIERLAVVREEAYALQKRYFREHGTTMRGLMRHHGVDPADFLAFVHDIDLAPVDPNPALDTALARLSGRKIIFTNGSTEHAARVTRRLGIDHHFTEVFDIVEAGYVPKPEPSVYETLVSRFALRPETSVMVEDMAKNLKPAADMGMTTVWVRNDCDWGRAGSDGDHVHHVIDDLTAWLAGVAGPR